MKQRFETFTMLIGRISRNIRKIKNQEMAEYGLRSTHISILYYLCSPDELTATDLAERCEEDKATISRSIEYLETNGYLTCESKSAKRYKSPLVLTEKGKDVAKTIREKVDHILDEVGKGLSEEERLSFYRSLDIISRNLERVCKNDK